MNFLPILHELDCGTDSEQIKHSTSIDMVVTDGVMVTSKLESLEEDTSTSACDFEIRERVWLRVEELELDRTKISLVTPVTTPEVINGGWSVERSDNRRERKNG